MKKLFSIISLVGVIAACQPEKLDTTFEPEDAVATITCSATRIDTGEDITAQVTFNASPANSANNVITLTGNPSIAATSVKVDASWEHNGTTYTESHVVPINALLAGGKASYTATFVLGVYTNPEDMKFYEEFVSSEVSSVKRTYFTRFDHSALHTHDGAEWAYNATEFVKYAIVNYQVISSEHVTGVNYDKYINYKSIVDRFTKNHEIEPEIVDDTVTFPVSAWSMYTAYIDVNTLHKVYNVICENKMGDKTVIAKFFVDSKGTAFNHEEAAHPNHASHYVEGHGVDDPEQSHGHGSQNAGGGIVIAD